MQWNIIHQEKGNSDACQNMDELQQYHLAREARHTRVYATQFHLYERSKMSNL